jgi:uncharacterized protein
MKRIIRFVILPLSIVCIATLVVIAYIGSKATLSPERRTVAEWHQTILNAPALHGLKVTHFTSHGGTPAMLCEPGPKECGTKSLALRAALRQRSIGLSPWGKIHGTILLLHGHKGCKEDHLPICERFCAAGFRCICIDLPGHGKHPKPYATFGFTEVQLVSEVWREFLETHPHAASQPLFLFGISQGGAIALQAAARDENTFRAVASVAAFSELTQPIDTSANHLPAGLRDIKPLTTRACALGIYCRAGFFPANISPLSDASQIRCPVFLCHGKNDSFVPVASARNLYDSISHSRKELRIIENAKHGNVLAVGSTELYADICGFFLSAL